MSNLKNQELQALFNNYKNLSQEDLNKLIFLIVKEQKNKLGLSLPVIIEFDWDEVNKNNAGGDSNLEFNEELKRYEYKIRLNAKNYYMLYLAERNKTSKMGDMIFDNSMDSLFRLIASLLHEIRHAYQNEMTLIKREIENPEALIWIKERICITDNDFYRNSHNYQNMSRELDAYDYMYKEAIKYIQTYTVIEINNPMFFQTLQNLVEQNKKTSIESLTFIENGEEISILDYYNKKMDIEIKNIPVEQISDSILKYEYNSDGTRKTYSELMRDKESLIASLDKNLSNYNQLVQKIERIYEFIIKGNTGFKLEQNSLNLTDKVERENFMKVEEITKSRFSERLEKMGIDVDDFVSDLFTKAENIETAEVVESSERKVR